MNLKRLLFILVVLGSVLSACKSKGDKPVEEEPLEETTTRGEITIAIDESLEPLFQAQVENFTTTYSSATIHYKVLSEVECFKALSNREVRLVIVSRNLTKVERDRYEAEKIFPDETVLGKDAIALVVNQANPNFEFTMDQLKGIFSGELKTWKDIDPENPLEGKAANLTLVVDNGGSGTVRYLKDSMLGGGDLAPNLFSANTSRGVLDFVRNNKGALGVLGINLISDRDDRNVDSLMQNLKLVALEANAPDTSEVYGQFLQPWQSFLYSEVYPLTREVVAVSREPKLGLGTGFVSFVAGEKGQRMFLKAGLVPEFPPPRYVKFPAKEGAQDILKVIEEENAKKLEEKANDDE